LHSDETGAESNGWPKGIKMRALGRRLKKLEEACLPKTRRLATIFLEIPGGKPARAYFGDGGPPVDWLGGNDYPPVVKVYEGIDPDALFGTCPGEGTAQATS
jgi:hypothetical protein